MFLFGLVEGRKLGLLNLDDLQCIQKAWTGLAGKVNESGEFIGVSGGTSVLATFEKYNKVPTGRRTWGTGAFLLAGSALLK